MVPGTQRTWKIAELFGVEPPPEQGRDRIVAAAIELFYAHGFQGVGLDQVIAEAGVTKTTFYRHFESRDDLMVAAVKQRDAWEMVAWDRAVERIGGDDPRAQLLAVFDVLDVWFNDEKFGGCMFINTAGEFPSPTHPVHRAAAEHKRKSRDVFASLAIRAGAAEPNAFADRFALLVEGTLVMRQVHGRDDAAVLARPMAEQLIDEFIPLSASPL